MPSIIDPIYGRINISGLEQIIINTPGMARLRRVQQLGLADLAFPGANHTRFEHSIGTLYIADKIARYLELGEEEIMKVRLAGLLHDIGHSAFSHVVESILRRNPQYQPALGGKKFMHHEMFSRHIIGSSFHVIPEIRAQTETFGKPELFFEEIAEIATGDQDGLSKPHLAQIISDDIDADRIDFLLRDSYHTGVSLGLVDLDQIVGSLSLSGGRIVLGGSLSYDEDMALTAAESMLIARAHHYSAIIHNPRTQGARVMLLHALENALLKFESSDVKAYVLGFFTSFNDGDMLNFIETNGDTSTKRLIRSIRDGRICNAIARFTHKNLNPRTRMALSTIAKNGVAKKNFEDELSKRIADKHGMSVLVDLDIASGIPRSTRVRIGDDESFFYDESALANGLVRAISRQISLCVFGRSTGLSEASSDLLAGIESLSPDLLRFIRNENYLPVEGLLLIFFSAHRMFSREEDGRLVMPRLRNIAKIYQLVRELGAKERLSNLFDYKFHSRYGFPYSDRLFEDIQILVAMGMVDEDLRYFEKNGRWKQRYEYVLTSDGLGYAEMIAHSYQNELKIIDNHLMMNKHSIPRDMVSITSGRYGKGMKDRSHQHGK